LDTLTLLRIDQALYYAWPISEIVLGQVRRARASSADVRDRGSMVLLWIVIGASIALALFARHLSPHSLRLTPLARGLGALALFAVGIGLRVWSIVTLGRFFTVNVAVHADHRVVRSGPYRWLRHPSYTGAMIAFSGLGVLTGSALSLAILVLGIGAAFLYRIAIEEAALRAGLGEAYAGYARVTKRLIPFVY